MFCILKKYRDILGIPGKGLHRIKFRGTAIVDYILTIIVATNNIGYWFSSCIINNHLVYNWYIKPYLIRN